MAGPSLGRQTGGERCSPSLDGKGEGGSKWAVSYSLAVGALGAITSP